MRQVGPCSTEGERVPGETCDGDGREVAGADKRRGGEDGHHHKGDRERISGGEIVSRHQPGDGDHGPESDVGVADLPEEDFFPWRDGEQDGGGEHEEDLDGHSVGEGPGAAVGQPEQPEGAQPGDGKADADDQYSIAQEEVAIDHAPTPCSSKISQLTVTSPCMARVLLLFGGRSAEHEVSCVSAVAVSEALSGAGHEVSLIGIDRSGGWHLVEAGDGPLSADGPPAHFEVPEGVLRSGATSMRFDVVFPVLHGPYGEDGTVQGLLEIAGIPYVGCDVLSSALGMDKDIAKRLATHAGIASPEWQVVRGPGLGDAPATVSRLVDEMGLPLFVKPAALGSSVGITKAETEAELKEGLEEAFRYGRKVVVEEAIVGREIEVAVLEGPRASVPGEIVIETDWYDYDSKYADESSRFVAPADLSDAEAAQVRALACRAFETYECKGLARVDFLFEQGGRGFLLNEVNTMPGFTPISGFPKMWEASGMSYAELCDELVTMALGS